MLKAAAKSVTEAVAFLRHTSVVTPVAAVVLGSGVKVLEDLSDEVQYQYDQVFGIAPGIAGHSGSLCLGKIDGRLVAVLRGRFHLYEGYDWDTVTLPTRVLVEWGVPWLYLTNAAGGINSSFHVGDLMLLTGYRDHLHPRWKDSGLIPALLNPTIDAQNELTSHILKVSKLLTQEEEGFELVKQGVYAALLGPTYETLAEIGMLRHLGADAVGMSTAPELETANGTSTKAAAISVITNVWSDEADIDGHDAVLRAAKAASERLDKLLRRAIALSSADGIH